MALLLKDAIRPNLVQTLEGGPAFVHAGPFGNIAHGCNSILATRSALALADIVVTEAGFGSDLGAEKFFDIKCRVGGLQPGGGGARRDRALAQDARRRRQEGSLGAEDLGALERGLPNLEQHIENVQQFGVPVVVAINRVRRRHRRRAADGRATSPRGSACRVALTEVWEKGGAGGEALGAKRARAARRKGAEFRAALRPICPIKEKIDIIVRQIYGGDGVDYSPAGRSRDRVPRVDRARQHADLHGEDAVLAHRRRHQAWPARADSGSRQRGPARRAPGSSSRSAATS